MKYLEFMTRTDGPRAVYLAKAFGAALLGTIAIATLSGLLLPADPRPDSGTTEEPSVFALMVIWPVVSTLVLWPVLAGLKRVTPTYWHAAGASALAFGIVFALLAGPQSGLIFVWPYFLYSLTFLAWQLKSDVEAFGMTALLQSAVMALPAMIISLSR